MSFNCTYLCNVSIFWNGPGVEAGNSKLKMEMNATTSTLMITNVNNSHAGEYFCTAQFSENDQMMTVNSTVGILSVSCKYILIMQRLFTKSEGMNAYEILIQI